MIAARFAEKIFRETSPMALGGPRPSLVNSVLGARGEML